MSGFNNARETKEVFIISGTLFLAGIEIQGCRNSKRTELYLWGTGCLLPFNGKFII
jgi:hypothetical protein